MEIASLRRRSRRWILNFARRNLFYSLFIFDPAFVSSNQPLINNEPTIPDTYLQKNPWKVGTIRMREKKKKIIGKTPWANKNSMNYGWEYTAPARLPNQSFFCVSINGLFTEGWRKIDTWETDWNRLKFEWKLVNYEIWGFSLEYFGRVILQTWHVIIISQPWFNSFTI